MEEITIKVNVLKERKAAVKDMAKLIVWSRTLHCRYRGSQRMSLKEKGVCTLTMIVKLVPKVRQLAIRLLPQPEDPAFVSQYDTVMYQRQKKYVHLQNHSKKIKMARNHAHVADGMPY